MVRRKRDFFEWEFTKKMNAVGLWWPPDGISLFIIMSPSSLTTLFRPWDQRINLPCRSGIQTMQNVSESFSETDAVCFADLGSWTLWSILRMFRLAARNMRIRMAVWTAGNLPGNWRTGVWKGFISHKRQSGTLESDKTRDVIDRQYNPGKESDQKPSVL